MSDPLAVLSGSSPKRARNRLPSAAGTRLLRRPDWPGPGPIDLEIHDRPHASSSVEWWYINVHLMCESQKPYSLFVSFFLSELDDDSETVPTRRAKTVIWGLTDVSSARIALVRCSIGMHLDTC